MTTQTTQTTQAAPTTQSTIGTVTTYHGTEFGFLRGYQVRIVGVFKCVAEADEEDGKEWAYVTDEAELARLGGVDLGDRVEVQPWIAREGRFSFVTSDPRAGDLACFGACGE